ncbi:hypothetical protein [Dictyobacter aurantiacus]|uniref:Uncharacterized protein n=1 Tax=Dictyobacter aurantiacus TaxID=1936993 RepID=A0A401ZET3_9CHLR|nr:hypothetical protein [Dictyobacter aurantiacus]GCE05391.1 hypothetical protein KDAU_27200 [Dictyobacter aurantiacus]
MSSSFDELYRNTLNSVFLERARQQLEQGVDGLALADAYADQGKPDFSLAHLLLVDAPDDVKREILARAYERRADLTDEKAENFDKQFHRPFPLVKLEAQKDRMSAQQVRQQKRIRRGTRSLNMN